MNLDSDFYIILTGSSDRETIAFRRIEVDEYQPFGTEKLTVWTAYPYSIYQLHTMPSPLYGCGYTPELAFKDLLLKKENVSLFS